MRKNWAAAVLIIIFCSLCFCGSEQPERPVIFSSLEEARRTADSPAVLVFFLVDCPACYQAIFEVRSMLDEYGPAVELIGITIGDRKELEEFVDRHEVELALVLDRRKTILKRYGVNHFPYKLALAGDKVIYRDDLYMPGEMQYEELRRCLNSAFSRSSSN